MPALTHAKITPRYLLSCKAHSSYRLAETGLHLGTREKRALRTSDSDFIEPRSPSSGQTDADTTRWSAERPFSSPNAGTAVSLHLFFLPPRQLTIMPLQPHETSPLSFKFPEDLDLEHQGIEVPGTRRPGQTGASSDLSYSHSTGWKG